MPRSRHWLIFFSCCYVLLLAALTLAWRIGPDRWWLGAFLLYLPQAIWLIPGSLLIVFHLIWAPRMVWVPALCLLWVAGPIMGFCRPWSSEAAGGERLRVMTWNVKYGFHDKRAILELLREVDLDNPDLLLFQDATGAAQGPVGEYLKGWQVRSFGQYLIASRHPLSEATPLPIPIPGEPQECLRCEMRLGDRKLVLYDVHLQTPREGLGAFRQVRRVPRYLPKAIGMLQTNVSGRFIQARRLVDYLLHEQGPVLVAGDLNSPDPSLTCRMLRDAGFSDAFAAAGEGYGYTYGHFLLKQRFPRLQFSWMRIDHIMTSRQLSAIRCWTGTRQASDHRPVIADLVWSGR